MALQMNHEINFTKKIERGIRIGILWVADLVISSYFWSDPDLDPKIQILQMNLFE